MLALEYDNYCHTYFSKFLLKDGDTYVQQRWTAGGWIPTAPRLLSAEGLELLPLDLEAALVLGAEWLEEGHVLLHDLMEANRIIAGPDGRSLVGTDIPPTIPKRALRMWPHETLPFDVTPDAEFPAMMLRLKEFSGREVPTLVLLDQNLYNRMVRIFLGIEGMNLIRRLRNVVPVCAPWHALKQLILTINSRQPFAGLFEDLYLFLSKSHSTLAGREKLPRLWQLFLGCAHSPIKTTFLSQWGSCMGGTGMVG